MNKWKISFFVTLALLLGSTTFFLYVILDQGVSYTYQQVSLEDQVKANEILGNLIVKGAKNYSQKDLLHLLRQANPKAFIVEDYNQISMGQVTFLFENDRLIKIY